MELMNRVRAILDERNISQASFARKIDVSPQVLSGWMMGRRTPGIAELAAMAEELHVSPSYLLTGRDDDPNRQSLVDDDGVCIPLLDVHASCGNGVQLATTTVVKMIKVNHQWINRYCGTANPQALNIIGVTGDSMTTTLADGDFVVIDTSATRAYTDSMFAFKLDNDLFIKRFQRQGRNIKVISDNPRYEPYILTPEEMEHGFKVLGRVVTTCVVRAV